MPTREQYQNTARQREAKVATCIKCKVERPWEDFNPCPSRRPFGLASCCKPCDADRKLNQRNAWRRKQTKEFLHQHDYEMRLRKFNLTVKEYESMVLDQCGLCAICGNPETAMHPRTGQVQRLAIDHCHNSGKNRGLLCARCNKGLGHFKDNRDLLKNAIKYLENHHG